MKTFVKVKIFKIAEPFKGKDGGEKTDDLVKCILVVKEDYKSDGMELSRKLNIKSLVVVPKNLEGTEQLLEVEVGAYKKTDFEVAITYKCIAIVSSVSIEQKGK